MSHFIRGRTQNVTFCLEETSSIVSNASFHSSVQSSVQSVKMKAEWTKRLDNQHHGACYLWRRLQVSSRSVELALRYKAQFFFQHVRMLCLHELVLQKRIFTCRSVCVRCQDQHSTPQQHRGSGPESKQSQLRCFVVSDQLNSAEHTDTDTSGR